MRLFVNGLFAAGPLLAGVFFTGCASSSLDPSFFDNPTPPPTIGANSPAMGVSGGDPSVARFHVGDTVVVILSGLSVEFPPHEEPIKEDGSITMPDIGHVQAVGKTAGELQNTIHDLYVPKYYVRLTVTVKSGDRVYYVGGEVNGSGRQLYVGEITVSKAIKSAGDFKDFASHTVWLIRASGQRIKVDVDKVLDGKASDPLVYPGDQIQVKRSLW